MDCRPLYSFSIASLTHYGERRVGLGDAVMLEACPVQLYIELL